MGLVALPDTVGLPTSPNASPQPPSTTSVVWLLPPAVCFSFKLNQQCSHQSAVQAAPSQGDIYIELTEETLSSMANDTRE